MRKQKFVLDTSAFTNVGKTKSEIDRNIKKLIKLLETARDFGVYCYIPYPVWTELKGMLERKNIPKKMIETLDVWLIQKSPSRIDLKVPAEFLYEYVEEIRARFNKGLSQAEKSVLKASEGKIACNVLIGDLRNSFRTEIRQGMLDSIEDLEVLLLAKELNAGIVSKDFGIKNWAKKWGVHYMDADVFHRHLAAIQKSKKLFGLF